ncbi:hypothetical protein G195_005622 [Phytophthora kernoviae 00238/432]|uniref:Tryptophan synthase beta chain-like PALP domain-containing protein n=1 Tax=Phytophthora kernoviae 00238/432 TaxID=1284355 RepID=A0A8J4WC47_9STRA|nr:hypothetical protein G195_005622 [Phytophthora kernoviae 00238/432]
MAKVVNNVTELIGGTPLVRLNRIVPEGSAEVFVKLEYQNPGSSVKDRIAISIVEEAEKEGKLKPGDTIIEATSGNTGIGLAMVAAAKGYKSVIVMPETMSMERRNLLRAYGAELVLTPGAEANVKIHRETTGPEIVEAIQSVGGTLDAFIAGIGTGGTITGTGEVLKEAFPEIKIVAVEPSASPILAGGKPGPHKIQGIGANFIPEILDQEIYDEIIHIENDDAFETARQVAKEEGILSGISSGAAIRAGLQVAKQLGAGKRVVVIVPSNGERYLSTPLYNFES